MSKLNRELGAANLVANFAYLNTDMETFKNDYDNCYPWSDMKVITDSDGNKWLQIPKFYTKYEYDENGYVCARYISRYNVSEDWHLNPAFLNSAGKELSSIEIACYQTSVDSTTNKPMSKSGLKVAKGNGLTAMKSLVDNYDVDEKYDYSLYDIWTHILIQDLFLIEFADDEPDKIMPGYSAANYSKGLLDTGTTDTLSYKSGIPCNEGANISNYGMVYRTLENIIGNGTTVLDNIVLENNNTLTVYINGQRYVVEYNIPIYSGTVDKLFFDKNTKLIFPAVLKESGSYGSMYNGPDTSTTNNKVIQIGGFFAYQFVSANPGGNKVYRMIRKQK